MRWPIRGVLAAVLVFAVVAASPATAQDDPDAPYLRGLYAANGLLNRGMHELAAEEYRSFLRDYPDSEQAPVAHYGLGVCLFQLLDYEGAVAELDPLRTRGGFAFAAEAGTIVGQCHLALGHYESAAESLGQVLRDHADHDLADDAAALRTEALYALKRHAEVEQAATDFLAQWPRSDLRERTELYWSLADMARGRHGSAADRLADMARRFDDSIYADQVALLRAQCHHHQGERAESRNLYRQVIEADDDRYTGDAMYGLATLMYQQGEPRAATEVIDRMLERFPDHGLAPPARLLLCRSWFDLGEYERAQKLLGTISAGEQQDDVAYWSAKCEIRRGEPTKAAGRLRTALDQFTESPLRPEMTYDLGVARSQADDQAAAADTLEGFLRSFPEHGLTPNALHLLATIRHQLGAYDESLAVCRRFEERFGGHELASAVAFLMAENDFLQGHDEEAALAYEAFLRRFEDDPQRTNARFRLGMAQYRLGRLEEANASLAAVTAAGETKPEYRPALLALGSLHFEQRAWPQAEEHLRDYLSFGSGQPSADDAMLKLALALHRQAEHEEALALLDGLLGAFPESPHHLQATFERGQTLVALERDADAAEAFQEVLDEGADSRFAAHALNHLGAIASSRGAYAEAAGFFGQVAGATSDEDLAVESTYQEGLAQIAGGAFPEAARTLAGLIEEYPNASRRSDAVAQLAIALSRQSRFDEAVRIIAGLERSELPNLDAELRTAVVYEKAWCLKALDRDPEAADAYRALLAGEPYSDLHNHALLELAELHANEEEYAEACRLLRRMLEDAPSEVAPDPELREDALYRLGAAEFSRGQYAAATEALGRFVAEHPESDALPPASLLCGEALMQAGKHEEAVAHLQRVVDGHQTNDAYGPALLRLGECLNTLQEWSRSEACFDRYVQAFPDSPLLYQARFGLGWARENQDRHEDAIVSYREVVGGHPGPTAARAQFQIGECLFAQGRFEAAVRELLKVDILYAYPEWSAAALYEAGRCFQKLKDPVRARKQFEHVRRDHGETRWAKLASEQLTQMSRPALPGH